jgi:RNA polymerase sigma factor (sigma-70 family)
MLMTPATPARSDAEIIGELYDGLVRFAAVVAPRGADPDDLVHDALVRTISRRSLADIEHPQAYVRRAILNLAANRRRSAIRQLRAVVRIGPPPASEDHYPSDALALLDLAPQTRAVLWLADVEGQSFEAIAAHLGLTAASARQRASRGRAEIRERIVNHDFGDPTGIEGVAP